MIGITPVIQKTKIPDGPNVDLKLKPPKFPKSWDKSKKTYKDLFVRSLKKSSEHHIYHREGVYVVSLYKTLDEAIEWIDRNYTKIQERVNDIKKYRCNDTDRGAQCIE